MGMYYPDLASVQKVATDMSVHQEEHNKYKGLIPKTEEELPEARKQLAKYFRTVWKDEIAAIEVEAAVTEEDYEDKISQSILFRMLGYDSEGNRD